MKNFLLLVNLLLLTGCCPAGLRLTGGAIRFDADLCTRSNLTAEEVLDSCGYVIDVRCRLPAGQLYDDGFYQGQRSCQTSSAAR